MLTLFILLICSGVLALPSDHNRNQNFNIQSPGFNIFSPVPDTAHDQFGNWIDDRYDLGFGNWDTQSNAHILDPVHPHQAGLPFPTPLSQECASVVGMIREGVLDRGALLPYIHESLHEDYAPQASVPSTTMSSQQQYQQEEEEHFQDAQDGSQANEQQQADWHFYEGLGDLQQGNLHGAGGPSAARSSFHHEQGFEGMLDAIPAQYVQDDDSGRRSSVHFENYAANDLSAFVPQGSWPSESEENMIDYSAYQYPQAALSTQDSVNQPVPIYSRIRRPYKPKGKSTKPSIPKSLKPSTMAARDRFLAHQRSQAEEVAQIAQGDAALMGAWEAYKTVMHMPNAVPEAKDPLWTTFIKHQAPEIIQDLNSGDMQMMLKARSLFSAHFSHNLHRAIHMLPLSSILEEHNLALSDWAWAQNTDGGHRINQLLLKICQLMEIPVNSQESHVAKKFWKGRLLTRTNERNVAALLSGVLQRQYWALADLANLKY